VLAAIRDADPSIEVDWLADRKYAPVLDFVDGISERIIGRPGLSNAVARLRARAYDVAIDLQGLMKSAAMARLAGAERVIGFDRRALREQAAAWFYNESAVVPPGAHIVQKNLCVVPLVGIAIPTVPRFPFTVPSSAVADEVSAATRASRRSGIALINPGAAWPNKRWPAERFGAVARHIRDCHDLAPIVLWGGNERDLADAVVAASQGAALRAPETTLGDVLSLAARASLMVSGDTGPLHLAAAVGTRVVGLYGPTWPERNGPWHPADVVVSRAAVCECHHKRGCRRDARDPGGTSRMCLNDIDVAEVTAAVDRRLIGAEAQR
jgi:heptosyltransferase I